MYDVHTTLVNARLRLGYSLLEYHLGDDPVEPYAYLTYDQERAMWSAG